MKITDIIVEEEFGEGVIAVHFESVDEANDYIKANRGFNTLYEKLVILGKGEEHFGTRENFVHAISQLQDMTEMDLTDLLDKLIKDCDEVIECQAKH